MTTFGFDAASLALRRVLPAALLAATATLAGSAGGNPAIACAESRELDAAQYDNCLDGLAHSLMAGDITDGQFVELHQQCCRIAGGDWTPHGSGGGLGTCGAPPAVAASTPVAPPSENANPDVPAGPPPPTKPSPSPTPTPKTPKTSLTLAPIAPVG